MNKPIPVKIVEVLGWMYVALAVLLILVLVISAVVAVDRDGEIWPLVLCGSFLLLLSLGMALSLRRGRRGWFLVPHTVILSLFLLCAIASLCASVSLGGAVVTGLVVLLLVAPIVLLWCPSASRWFNEMSGDDSPRPAGCALFMLLVILGGIGGCIFSDYQARNVMRISRLNVMSFRARELSGMMAENEEAKKAGAEWIDPAVCTNSTQFIRALVEKSGNNIGCEDFWCVAVNPPDDDIFPVLVTANIDPRELLNPSDADARLTLVCPKKVWGGVCRDFCEKGAVVVYKNGVSQTLKRKWARPRLMFRSVDSSRDDIPVPRPDTYFLTPTGRVDLVEGQKNAMSNSVNFKYLSVNESERGVVAEFLLENRAQRGMFVFGSDDALATYFLKDGAWVFCSMANDVESSNPAGEKGLFVEKGNSLRVSGRIPQECLRTKWFIVVGISMRNEDEMESVVASPVYSRGNELGEGLSFKGEMNSVFKGRLKAFIANE